MNKEELVKGIEKIENYASQSKFYRLLATPGKYLAGIFFRKIYFPFTGKGVLKITKTFWGDPIRMLLPASMDIYLTGGKTHDSETRLAKFLVHHLNEKDDVLDIGSHIGYFSLLASYLSPGGLIIAVEASPKTFSMLEENIRIKSNIQAVNIGVSDHAGVIEFLEFPALYSEYNTLEQDQYKNEAWFKSNKASKVKIRTQKGTDIIERFKMQPKIIKIDVEGAEEKVILGLKEYLKNNSAYVVMEYANQVRGNDNHVNAESHLREMNYSPYKINPSGQLKRLTQSTSSYITESRLESDNIVYFKN